MCKPENYLTDLGISIKGGSIENGKQITVKSQEYNIGQFGLLALHTSIYNNGGVWTYYKLELNAGMFSGKNDEMQEAVRYMLKSIVGSFSKLYAKDTDLGSIIDVYLDNKNVEGQNIAEFNPCLQNFVGFVQSLRTELDKHFFSYGLYPQNSRGDQIWLKVRATHKQPGKLRDYHADTEDLPGGVLLLEAIETCGEYVFIPMTERTYLEDPEIIRLQSVQARINLQSSNES